MEFAPPIITYCVLAAVFLAVIRRERSGALTRNSTVGIRTRRTMSSDDAWRVGHRAAASYLRAAALVSGAFAAALAIVVVAELDECLAHGLAVSGYVVVLVVIALSAVAANRAVDAGSQDD